MSNMYIIRHCEAQGQAPNAALTEKGRRQAEALAHLAEMQQIDIIVTSPYERAYRTIQPLAERLGLKVVTDERLIERVLCGQDAPQWRDMLRRTYDDPHLCYPGGESTSAAAARANQVVSELLEQGYHEPAIVSHGNLISLLLRSWDATYGFAEWEAMTNPDIYKVSWNTDIPLIRRLLV
ncbi:histidine phosphatase family protein [Paenibacillus shenyangensis]|uniref:histidine phosphatase family protein n=1 Tax=Paenibacillus sp. A9 TaxID=1284352 RepID=UPI000364A75D|nr:histidine phosphatase family protein [Paenibacillus sp. A9]